MNHELIRIPADDVHMEALLELSADHHGLVLFATGIGLGSSHHNPRHSYMAKVLHERGIGTLRLDLLTLTEDLDYQSRFDITLITHRLLIATYWVKLHTPAARRLPLGYFGTSTGAAAALQACAALDNEIEAIVSSGGRPDLAGSHELAKVKAPTLLTVGSRDEDVLELNREAFAQLSGVKQLSVIDGATHQFEEAGALEEVARQSANWFSQYLSKPK